MLYQPDNQQSAAKEVDNGQIATTAVVLSDAMAPSAGIEEGNRSSSDAEELQACHNNLNAASIKPNNVGVNGTTPATVDNQDSNLANDSDAMVVDPIRNDIEASSLNLQPSETVKNNENVTVMDPAQITNAHVAQKIESSAAASYVIEVRKYLQGISKSDRWVKLVSTWLEFENICTVHGVSIFTYI